MKICLDMRSPDSGGTSTFTNNYLKFLNEVNVNHEFIILVNHWEGNLSAPNMRVMQVPRLTSALQLGWAQFYLPGLLKGKNIDLYHSMKHLGPVFNPVKSIYRVRAVGQFCGIFPLKFFEKLYWERLGKIIIKKLI
jgi:hypothetical protein